MSDELDQLSDAALSEVFAVEITGASKPGRAVFWGTLPVFATSADAVLPYLEKATQHGAPPIDMAFMDGAWCATFDNYVPSIQAKASTFARSACIALIRAKRAEKEAA